MKPYLTLALILGCGVLSYGQTNTFPSSGNVGIGTPGPTMPLSIESTNAAGISLFRSGLDVGQVDFSNNDFNIRSNSNNMRFDVPAGKVITFATGEWAQLTLRRSYR